MLGSREWNHRAGQLFQALPKRDGCCRPLTEAQPGPRPVGAGAPLQESSGAKVKIGRTGGAQNRIDHSLSSFKELSRWPRGSRAALDGIAVSLCRTRPKASVADSQPNAYPVVVEWVAALSPRVVRDNPESVPHGW